MKGVHKFLNWIAFHKCQNTYWASVCDVNILFFVHKDICVYISLIVCTQVGGTNITLCAKCCLYNMLTSMLASTLPHLACGSANVNVGLTPFGQQVNDQDYRLLHCFSNFKKNKLSIVFFILYLWLDTLFDEVVSMKTGSDRQWLQSF